MRATLTSGDGFPVLFTMSFPDAGGGQVETVCTAPRGASGATVDVSCVPLFGDVGRRHPGQGHRLALSRRGSPLLRPQGHQLGDELRGVQVLGVDLGAEAEPRDDQPGRRHDVEPLPVVPVGPVGVLRQGRVDERAVGLRG